MADLFMGRAIAVKIQLAEAKGRKGKITQRRKTFFERDQDKSLWYIL